MVKLLRSRPGCKRTSTELPVLDFACTAARKRAKNEKRIVPRDNNMISLVSDPGSVKCKRG